eukprot:2515121-Prymnesium_polylepis.1
MRRPPRHPRRHRLPRSAASECFGYDRSGNGKERVVWIVTRWVEGTREFLSMSDSHDPAPPKSRDLAKPNSTVRLEEP